LCKGQVFFADMIIAMGIFVVIMLTVASAWDFSREKTYRMELRNDMEVAARTALSALMKTSGNPSDWHTRQPEWFNETNVKSLGLSKNEPWYINDLKLQKFEEWEAEKYDTYKKILGLQFYDFYMDFWEYNGTFDSSPDYSVGNTPNTTAENVVKLQRVALSDTENNKWLKIEMGVWK
jgi:hypothetical protein